MRFAFGRNWQHFLKVLDEPRIELAMQSLQAMLEAQSLSGKTFLDIGSGSGLFSLAARRLGARVHSFDYDAQSVACTQELKRRYFCDDSNWTVEQGSVLDEDYMRSLGTWDIVYSWGVLHHTGAIWHALDAAARLVVRGGRLFVAIYNDQGRASKFWLTAKASYNAAPQIVRPAIVLPLFLLLWGPTTVRDIVVGRPFSTWREYAKTSRGMDAWRDVIDWIGGYPFEVAKPEAIFQFFRERGFSLDVLKTCAGGLGCNEFVFSYDRARDMITGSDELTRAH